MLRSGPACVIRLHVSLTARSSTYESILRPWERNARLIASDAEASPKESRKSDYNETEGPVKEDFIDTPLPGVSEEARQGKKRWPHQGEKELREDLDIPDEGEAISKTPSYNPHTDPKATPDLSGRRSYHAFRALSHRVRGLHSADIFLAEKHPDDRHTDELREGDKSPNDAQHGILPGILDFLAPETEAEAAMDSSSLQDADTHKDQRMAKEPDIVDRVHGSNARQARKAATAEVASTAH